MSDTASSASSASSSRTSFSGESRVTMSSTSSSDAASTISDASSARTTGSSVLGQYVYSSYKAITESVRSSRPATEEDREKQLARAQAKEAKRAAQAQRDREMQEMRLREYAALRQSADDAKARLKSGKPLTGMYNSQAANHCVLRYM